MTEKIVHQFDAYCKRVLHAKARHRLPEKKRTVILMSFYLGMSDADIGRILGRAGSSIHTRRVSALSMLRKLMEER